MELIEERRGGWLVDRVVIADVDQDDFVLGNNQLNSDAVPEVDGHAVQPRQLAGKCVKAK